MRSRKSAAVICEESSCEISGSLYKSLKAWKFFDVSSSQSLLKITSTLSGCDVSYSYFLSQNIYFNIFLYYIFTLMSHTDSIWWSYPFRLPTSTRLVYFGLVWVLPLVQFTQLHSPLGAFILLSLLNPYPTTLLTSTFYSWIVYFIMVCCIPMFYCEFVDYGRSCGHCHWVLLSCVLAPLAWRVGLKLTPVLYFFFFCLRGTFYGPVLYFAEASCWAWYLCTLMSSCTSFRRKGTP